MLLRAVHCRPQVQQPRGAHACSRAARVRLASGRQLGEQEHRGLVAGSQEEHFARCSLASSVTTRGPLTPRAQSVQKEPAPSMARRLRGCTELSVSQPMPSTRSDLPLGPGPASDAIFNSEVAADRRTTTFLTQHNEFLEICIQASLSATNCTIRTLQILVTVTCSGKPARESMKAEASSKHQTTRARKVQVKLSQC